MEVWARAPHNRQVSQLLEEQLRLWRDELAVVVDHGVREGAFIPPAALDDFTLRFTALLDGLGARRLSARRRPDRVAAVGPAVGFTGGCERICGVVAGDAAGAAAPGGRRAGRGTDAVAGRGSGQG